MRRIFRNATPVFLGAMISIAALQAQATYPYTSLYCNNMLIKGDFGFTIEGSKLLGSPSGAQEGVAMTHFDGSINANGEGNLQQIDAVTIGGVQVSDFTHPVANGTYSVAADCTGTFTITFADGRPPVTTNFVVVDNGNEIDTVVKGVPLASQGQTQAPGVIATRSIGKRRFTFPLTAPRISQPLVR